MPKSSSPLHEYDKIVPRKYYYFSSTKPSINLQEIRVIEYHMSFVWPKYWFMLGRKKSFCPPIPKRIQSSLEWRQSRKQCKWFSIKGWATGAAWWCCHVAVVPTSICWKRVMWTKSGKMLYLCRNFKPPNPTHITIRSPTSLLEKPKVTTLASIFPLLCRLPSSLIIYASTQNHRRHNLLNSLNNIRWDHRC